MLGKFIETKIDILYQPVFAELEPWNNELNVVGMRISVLNMNCTKKPWSAEMAYHTYLICTRHCLHTRTLPSSACGVSLIFECGDVMGWRPGGAAERPPTRGDFFNQGLEECIHRKFCRIEVGHWVLLWETEWKSKHYSVILACHVRALQNMTAKHDCSHHLENYCVSFFVAKRKLENWYFFRRQNFARIDACSRKPLFEVFEVSKSGVVMTSGKGRWRILNYKMIMILKQEH